MEKCIPETGYNGFSNYATYKLLSVALSHDFVFLKKIVSKPTKSLYHYLTTCAISNNITGANMPEVVKAIEETLNSNKKEFY